MIERAKTCAQMPSISLPVALKIIIQIQLIIIQRLWNSYGTLMKPYALVFNFLQIKIKLSTLMELLCNSYGTLTEPYV